MPAALDVPRTRPSTSPLPRLGPVKGAMNHRSLWVPLGSACAVSASPSEEIIKLKVAIKHVKEGLAGGREQPVCRRGCPEGARGFQKQRQQPGASFPTSLCPPASRCRRGGSVPSRALAGGAQRARRCRVIKLSSLLSAEDSSQFSALLSFYLKLTFISDII